MRREEGRGRFGKRDRVFFDVVHALVSAAVVAAAAHCAAALSAALSLLADAARKALVRPPCSPPPSPPLTPASFYCIVLLSTLFVTSCYWHPFPLDTPLSVPWSANITSFADALNASLPSNFSYSRPAVIRAVDRCWCDFSAGLFDPFNVSHWEYLTVTRLKNELERVHLDPNATAPSNVSSTVQAQIPSSTVQPESPGHSWSFLKDWINRSPSVEEKAEKEKPVGSGPREAEPWLRKEYDMRPYGFDVVVDISW